MAMDNKNLWAEMRHEVLNLRDGLGLSVDREIVDTVIALRLLGIRTTSSCGGHLERIAPGPYVRFESEQSQKLAKSLTIIKQTEHTDAKYAQLRRKAVTSAIKHAQRIMVYLDEFYQGSTTLQSDRLIMEFVPPIYCMLVCQGANTIYLVTAKERRDIITRHRAEMIKFTNFLKKNYLDL